MTASSGRKMRPFKFENLSVRVQARTTHRQIAVSKTTWTFDPGYSFWRMVSRTSVS